VTGANSVPAASMAFMVVSFLVSVGIPVALLIFVRTRYRAKLIPALVGAAAFFVFALVLEQIVHWLVLRPDAQGNNALRGQPFLFMLYGGLMAGLFEETARLLAFTILKKRIAGVQDALSYGIGHGGIEAILIVGVSMASNLVFSMLVNTGGMALIMEPLEGVALEQMQTAVTALTATPPYHFLLAGIERICAIALHIALSVVVFCAVFGKKTMWLYPVAIVLHALIDFPPALMQAGIITNFLVLEGIVAVTCAAVVALSVLIYRKWKPNMQPITIPNVVKEEP